MHLSVQCGYMLLAYDLQSMVQVYGLASSVCSVRCRWYVRLSGSLVTFPLQAMHEVAQRMQLRHPNIATVMGVATEPVTEDPLLVSSSLNPASLFAALQSKAVCAEMIVR